MAGSRYAYVRSFELPDPLLPSTFLVIRLDGKGFHAFSTAHSFDKPNDVNALELMNAAAKRTMEGRELLGECVMGFGESDEFSFVFRRSCTLYSRRASKLLTLVTSLFTSAYIFLWSTYFPNSPLKLDELPIFDGRIVQYSTDIEIRDYFRWRQVDTHINNMYNTCFWSLVQQGGRSTQEANKELSGTISSQKQELLWSKFNINYNELPAMFRKGSTLIWEPEPVSLPPDALETTTILDAVELPKYPIRAPKKNPKIKKLVVVIHEDLIKDEWWETGRGSHVLV